MKPRNNWKWFGNAGHLIVGHDCRFHLATKVGPWLVSTVGQYWPSRVVREIHAGVYDPAWLSMNHHLKGDTFDSAYMKKFGYEEIGFGRTFETMVFKAGKSCTSKTCGCGIPEIDGGNLESDSYNDAGSATKGHLKMCVKWASKKRQ